MMKRKYLKMSVASAAGGLLFSGVALAAGGALNQNGPLGFNQFTATNGVITDTSTECASTWTCVSLDPTSNGMLMQQVTDPGNGVSYIRTIVTEANATGVAGLSASAGGLGFYSEAETRAAGGPTGGTNNIALNQRVSDADLDYVTKHFEGGFRAGGDLVNGTSATTSPGGGDMYILESITGGVTNFQFDSAGGGGNPNLQRIDQNIAGAGMHEKFAAVSTRGSRAAFGLTAAGTLGGTVMDPLAFTSSDNLQVVWVGQTSPGSTSAGRQFGFQEYRNWGTSDPTNPGTNSAGSTSTHLSSGPLGGFTSTGPWDWDASVFDMGGAPTSFTN
jgi:hypothetical protein